MRQNCLVLLQHDNDVRRRVLRVGTRRIVVVITNKGRIMFIDAVSHLKEGSQYEILRSLDDPSMIKIGLKGTFMANIDSSINTKKR